MEYEDEDDNLGGLYEGGHWIWDDVNNGLAYVSDVSAKTGDAMASSNKGSTGAHKFRDHVDVLEQIRFRRRYQRKAKPGVVDVVKVQDLKDIVLFTAPISMMSPMLISILHQPTTERFIRALILFCQYYLQVSEEMTSRMKEQESKIRTPQTDVIESEYRDNLADLRLLVAKEYFTLLLGGEGTSKFHHMGRNKKKPSLTKRDSQLFQNLLRFCVQIIWLALGRRNFDQIEVEVNRLFKSEIYNDVEHTLRTHYIDNMAKEERSVLVGTCVRRDRNLTMRSPLMNEVTCKRQIDHRLLSLGVRKFPVLTPRLRYMMAAIAGPEEELVARGISLGILGLPRAGFDTMLEPLPACVDSRSKASAGSSMHLSMPSTSRLSQRIPKKLYPDINLPVKEEDECYISTFPIESERIRPCSKKQLRRWQYRLFRILHPRSGNLSSHQVSRLLLKNSQLGGSSLKTLENIISSMTERKIVECS